MRKKKIIINTFVFFLCSILIGKEIDFKTSIGYAPSMQFADDTIGDTFSFSGMNIQFDTMLANIKNNAIGVGLSMQWNSTKTNVNERELHTHTIPIAINAVHEFKINNIVSLYNSLGLGVGIHRLKFANNNDILVEVGLSFIAESGIEISIYNDFYTKIGIGYLLLAPKDVLIHKITPSIGIGFRF